MVDLRGENMYRLQRFFQLFFFLLSFDFYTQNVSSCIRQIKFMLPSGKNRLSLIYYLFKYFDFYTNLVNVVFISKKKKCFSPNLCLLWLNITVFFFFFRLPFGGGWYYNSNFISFCTYMYGSFSFRVLYYHHEQKKKKEK